MGAIGHAVSKRHQARLNEQYVHKYPQVACFAFDLITASIHQHGRYEKHDLAALARDVFARMSRRSLCLDIGANIGNHALFFAEHFGKVIAFEPVPRTFKVLECNAMLVDNITPLNLGASDHEHVMEVSINPLNVGATTVTRSAKPGGSTASLNLVPVDSLDLGGPVDFIKIDVENHELECLHGAKNLLQRDYPVIAMEVLRDQIKDGTSAALEFLRSLGYSHLYHMKDVRRFSALPTPLAKLARVVFGLLTNRLSERKYVLEPISRLQNRNYGMLIFTQSPLD